MRACHRLAGGTAMAVLIACAAIPTSSGADRSRGFTRQDITELLTAHNTWRRKAGAASLRWTADLAASASLRASYLASHGCYIEHGLLPEDIGENLYHIGAARAEGRAPELATVTPKQVVDAWGEESADYNEKQDRCAPGRQCGHYTQIVWPSTEEVGCGMAVCPSLGQVWVCHYRPRGNIRILR
jgi:pathogenesis-related protein 1